MLTVLLGQYLLEGSLLRRVFLHKVGLVNCLIRYGMLAGRNGCGNVDGWSESGRFHIIMLLQLGHRMSTVINFLLNNNLLLDYQRLRL